MQPSPWDDLQTEGSAPQVMINGQTAQISTGFNNQVILLQPPSSAAKVIGILLIIWGAFNVIAILLNVVAWSSSEIREEQGLTSVNIMLSSVSFIISVATAILGGIWMMNYQRKGVYLVLIGIIVGFLFSVALSLNGHNDAAAANADINEDVFSGISIGLGAVCSAVCGLIVAIPLMIANNGLDDSKLFG